MRLQVRSGSPERHYLGADPRPLVGGYTNTTARTAEQHTSSSHAHASSREGLTGSADNGSNNVSISSSRNGARLRPFSPPSPTISTLNEAQGVVLRPWTDNGPQHAQKPLSAAIDAAASASSLASRSPSPLRHHESGTVANVSSSKSLSASSSLDAHLPAFMTTDEEYWSGCIEGHEEDDDYERGKSLGSNGREFMRFRSTTSGESLPTLQSNSAHSRGTRVRRAPLPTSSSSHHVAQLATRPRSSAGDFKPVRGVGGMFGSPPLRGRFGTSVGYRKHVMNDYNRKVRNI